MLSRLILESKCVCVLSLPSSCPLLHILKSYEFNYSKQPISHINPRLRQERGRRQLEDDTVDRLWTGRSTRMLPWTPPANLSMHNGPGQLQGYQQEQLAHGQNSELHSTAMQHASNSSGNGSGSVTSSNGMMHGQQAGLGQGKGYGHGQQVSFQQQQQQGNQQPAQAQAQGQIQGQGQAPGSAAGPGQGQGPLMAPPHINLSNVLHFLQTEWRRYERERNEWEIERGEMRVGRVGLQRFTQLNLNKSPHTCCIIYFPSLTRRSNWIFAGSYRTLRRRAEGD